MSPTKAAAALVGAVQQRLAHHYSSWQEARFDRRYGVETCGIHDDLAALGAGGAHLSDANGHEPFQLPVFRAIMRAGRVDPHGSVFVDFGSGKGRALLLADLYGFQRIIGVELAPKLHAIAQRNVQAFRRRYPRTSSIELHCGDAADFALPDADAFLCFYNPFGEKVLRKVAANIERRYRGGGRRLVIAYRNPVHSRVFEELPFLRAEVRNSSFVLYRGIEESR